MFKASDGGGAAAHTEYRHALVQAMTVFRAPFFRVHPAFPGKAARILRKK
jgi:hypothetical protein